MKKVEFKEYVKNLPNYLSSSEDQLYFVYGEKNYVLSNGSDFNVQYCLDNDIEIIRTEHNGGTIVSSKDDIYIVFFSQNNNNFGTQLCHKFLEFLKDRGINASYDGNDILVDDVHKVAANSKRRINYKYYTAVAFFGTSDVEIIKNVCTKSMLKIPKGLNEYGVTTEEVKQFIETI